MASEDTGNGDHHTHCCHGGDGNRPRDEASVPPHAAGQEADESAHVSGEPAYLEPQIL